MKICAVASMVVLVSGMNAQTRHTVVVHVNESAGIRRSNYPVNARVQLPQGALPDVAKTRLMLGDVETPAQTGAESKWPDGSVHWLSVDFNASLGPLENLNYRLEYGADLHAQAAANGLTVNETEFAVEVGRVRFDKSGVPLIASVRYRAEDIGNGINGLVVTDAAGKEHELSGAAEVKAEVVKRGPFYVVIQYTGRIPIDAGYSVAFTMTAEMTSGKSWVKVAATVDDPGKRLREISFHTPLALGAMPWEWDFGTEHWTYGVLRNAGESVELSQTVKSTGALEWKVTSGAQTLEAGTADRAKVIRWGHLQDGKEVIAFATEAGTGQAGTYVMTFAGNGQTAFRFRPATPAVQHKLAVWEHYVASPVHIGAATSPASILAPLVVTVDTKK